MDQEKIRTALSKTLNRFKSLTSQWIEAFMVDGDEEKSEELKREIDWYSKEIVLLIRCLDLSRDAVPNIFNP